ncbi:hypothetical protein CKO22_17155 [Thiococcus pfennigii]|nr:hypothetical protein [Thiococcus pfennigii]
MNRWGSEAPLFACTTRCLGPSIAVPLLQRSCMTILALQAGVYTKTLREVWSLWGPSRALLRWGLGRPLVAGLTHASLWLDRHLYPGFRRQAIEAPIFIVGHPRSGTTLAHRLLGETRRFATFELWQLMIPSLVGRRLAAPLIRRATRGRDLELHPSEVGHRVALRAIEEEEALFYHLFAGAFTLSTTPLAFADEDQAWLLEEERQPPPMRRALMAFFRGCLQRQLLYTGRSRVLAKMPQSVFRVRSLLEAFPDARFVYLVRSPFETIPSLISLQLSILRRNFDIEAVERVRPGWLERHVERQYQRSVRLYRYMEELLEQGVLGPDRLMTVRYPSLKADLHGTLERILAFAGTPLDGEEETRFAHAVQQETDYRPAHINRAAVELGLSPARIAQDLGFVCERHGFPMPHPIARVADSADAGAVRVAAGAR